MKGKRCYSGKANGNDRTGQWGEKEKLYIYPMHNVTGTWVWNGWRWGCERYCTCIYIDATGSSSSSSRQH
uniref:Uncharacterized protein n=1 Tax=Trichogramma kaykai TaxID=54128 RepID=A0ABD2WQ67_9HYME